MKRTIKIFIVAFILSISLKATAQWVQYSGSFGGPVNAFAHLGANIFAGTDVTGVFISSNNGENWTQTSLNNKYVRSFAVDGNNINNIFAGTEPDGVYLSTDNGTTWNQTALNSGAVYAIAVLGSNIFAGNGNSGIYLSTNNGANWSQTSLNNVLVYSLATLGNNIFAATYTGVYISTNNGTSWTNTGLNTQFARSLAVSGTDIFAGTAGYGVYLSTNDGTNWTQTALTTNSVLSLRAIGNNIFAGTGGTNGVYFSSNKGTSWIQKNQGFNVVPSVYALLLANDNIYAGTFENSVWRRSYSEIIIGIQNISSEIPAAFSLSQNYPNPFNPSTTIRYAVPRNGNVRLIIFDALGREVETFVNEMQTAGTYEVVWDASRYPSGVYFYKLITDNYSDTRRMLLIK
ncbi:MAG TPA: T9SS type A sorting domain-containing protein [Ignavibacteria bacterium]